MTRSALVALPLTLALATALSGCAFLNQLTPQGGGTPSLTPTPTPAVVSTDEAATAFTDTICTFNDAAFAFQQTWTDLEAPLRSLQEAASLAKIETGAAKAGLESVSWPAEIADDMVVIEEYLGQRMAKLDSILEAKAVEELEGIDFSTPEEVNTAASAVEKHLELGADYCPAPDVPGADEPTEEPDGGDPAAVLSNTMWTGTDSDGDSTEVFLAGDGSASVSVADAVYEGTWEASFGVLTLEVARADNALSFTGLYQPGSTTLFLNGTATNGHTWTVELQQV